MNGLAWLKNVFSPLHALTVPAGPKRLECIHHFIEEQVENFPHGVAVSCQGRELTYIELSQSANRLARYLQKRGAGPERVVGLGVTRSEKLIVAILAIWKAGAAYVPLESRFPKERLQYTVQDSDPVCILTEESVQDLWSGIDRDLILMDTDWPKIQQELDRAPECSATGENLAQVLYTSGSTGRPKGVDILHGGLVNFMHWFKVEPGIKSTDTVVATTKMTTDTSASELFMPLTAGARIVLVGNEGIGTRGLFELLEEQKATLVQGTPSLLQWFDEVGWKGKRDLRIISGGEALSRDVAEKLIPKCAELWNIYGPTETTIWSTLTRVTSGPGPVSIGHPICNTQIHILDENLKAVPEGQMGEICIGGAGVARGYRNLNEETAKRFVPDLVGRSPHSRIYRTGDLGRAGCNGEFEYLGRMDHQIKIMESELSPAKLNSR